MEEKFNWDNFSFFIEGREIKGIVPIKIKPKYIQEITYIIRTPDVRRFCSPLVTDNLFLN